MYILGNYEITKKQNKMRITKKEYVDAVVVGLFESNNDQKMIKAFLYRRVLNMTPQEVGQELKLSRIKVNMMIQTIPYKRLNNAEFDNNYNIALRVCEKYTIKIQTRDFLNHLADVKNRMERFYTTI